jgi:hypothetical protein
MKIPSIFTGFLKKPEALHRWSTGIFNLEVAECACEYNPIKP